MSRWIQACAIIVTVVSLSGCQVATPPTQAPVAATSQPAADLDGVKQYLLTKAAALTESASQLQDAAARYHALAADHDFDYAALWAADAQRAVALVEEARLAWKSASPLYEQIEGIVAGTPSLAHYDVDLDAGSAASDDPESAVSFDLVLPDGSVLEKPGNLFGVTESTLWGTNAEWRAPVEADFDGSGSVDFGEALPDANMLKGGADLLAQMTSDLLASGQEWAPTNSDAFTALVVMIPTMSEYFASWRDSRFVSGEASTQRDFVAISRLADIQDILGGLEVVYAEVRPLVESVDAEQAAQIADGMANLKHYVADIHEQEQGGIRFTPEEADAMGAEAQDRATAVTGRIAQIAAQLAIPLAE